MLSDTAAKQAKTDQSVTRILNQAPAQVVQSVSAGGFTYIDPHQEVFTDTGSGSNSLGSAQSVDLQSGGVPASASRAWVTVNMVSSRSGGDASDSQLYVEWLPAGGTDWLRIAGAFITLELVDDHTDDFTVISPLPLKGTPSGQVRVYEAHDTWTYTLKLFGYE